MGLLGKKDKANPWAPASFLPGQRDLNQSQFKHSAGTNGEVVVLETFGAVEKTAEDWASSQGDSECFLTIRAKLFQT